MLRRSLLALGLCGLAGAQRAQAPERANVSGSGGELVVEALLHLPVIGDIAHQRRPKKMARQGIFFAHKNKRERSANYDTSMNCGLFTVPDAENKAYHVHRIEPVIDRRVHKFGLVHHIDISFCRVSALESVDPLDPHTCDEMEDLMNKHKPCYQMLWAYDRGALEPFDAPPDAGFRVGKGTPFQIMAMQIHFLLPEAMSAEDLRRRKYVDTSGIRLHLTEHMRPENLGTFAFMGASMKVPPYSRGYKYVVKVPPEMLSEALEEDFEMAAKRGLTGLRLRRAHLHAHNHAKRVILNRQRGNVTTELARIQTYCGYGPCQQFQVIEKEDAEIRRTDRLSLTCLFDNPSARTLHYGVSNKQEMCGPILLYTPHKGSMVSQTSIEPESDDDDDDDDDGRRLLQV